MPKVVIIGRPNVGKSTLFNRLIGKRRAIVDETPGVTRDAIRDISEWSGRTFDLVDTGGIVADVEDPLLDAVYKKAVSEAEDADVILFMVDGKDGITAVDERIAELLRPYADKVIVVVNKIDKAGEDSQYEFYSLGFDDVIGISSMHGTRTGDLLDKIVSRFPEETGEAESYDELYPKVGIVGRPNVGKSTLLNALLGKERAVVSDIPGTTRDAVDDILETPQGTIYFVDTAGLRRRKNKLDKLEYYAHTRSDRAIRNANIILHVVDATEGFTHKDAEIAGDMLDRGKGYILLLNKLDEIVEKPADVAKKFREIKREIIGERPYLRGINIPIMGISAKEGWNVDRIVDEIWKVAESHSMRIPTSELNRYIEEFTDYYTPPTKINKPFKVYYTTQPSIRPPIIVMFVNHDEVADNYITFLRRRIHKDFGFYGVLPVIKLKPKEREKK
ncbi:MAG: ribosome biogenesis GTPase Der [Dictyoglomi bacterium]|nr:ribosome biogenesis GTPase Der [Dictyoglomota bacterium]